MHIGMGCMGLIKAVGIDEGFAILREAGFDCVDFALSSWLTYHEVVGGQYAGSPFDLPLDEQLARLRPYKEAAQRHGLRIWQAHAPYPTLTLNPQATAYVRAANLRCIALCGYLGCGHLVIHPAALDYEDKLPADVEWAGNIEMYGAMIDQLKAHGVIACLENIYTRYRATAYDGVCCEMDTVNRYLQTLNAMAGQRCFGFCLDTGHALLTRNDIRGAVLALGDNLTCVHIHDNDGIGDNHLPPYMGMQSWDRFLFALQDIGFSGCLSFEVDAMFDRFAVPVHRELVRLVAGIGRAFAARLRG